MVKKNFLCVLLATVVCSTTTGGQASDSQSFVTDRSLTLAEQEALRRPVSLVSLIANPEKYLKQVVAVEGYLHVQYEDERLYLSREDGEHLISDNALDVSFSKVNLLLQARNVKSLPLDSERALHKFDQRYVLLIGQFSEGQLQNVSRVLELPFGD